MSTPRQRLDSRPAPVTPVGRPAARTSLFSQPFQVGRADDCAVKIDDAHVSRRHIEVTCSGGRWSVRDLNSSNGIYVNEQRVPTAAIDRRLQLRLGGADGPLLTLEVDAPAEQTIKRAAHAP